MEMVRRTRQMGVPVIADTEEAIVGFDVPRLKPRPAPPPAWSSSATATARPSSFANSPGSPLDRPSHATEGGTLRAHTFSATAPDSLEHPKGFRHEPLSGGQPGGLPRTKSGRERVK